MAPKLTFICPYCFEKHRLRDVQYRCSNKMSCKEVPDIEMTKYENGDTRAPKLGRRTFASTSRNPFRVPKNAQCPACGQTTGNIVCPSCHNKLPESTLKGEDMIISVVGARNTGKSHFVGIIINELITRISQGFEASMEGFDDSYARWLTGFSTPLYQEKEKLPLTQSSTLTVDNGAYRPLIFSFKLRSKWLPWFKNRSFTLVFFDTAGEDLDDEDTMNTVNKYICRSAGIIFLLDPMQIPAVVDKLDPSVVRRASGGMTKRTTEPFDIMTRVSRLIRNANGWSEDTKINIPVAAVFSKFDAIESIVPDDCAVHNPSPHCAEKCFVMSDWHNVNGEIKALLKEWDAAPFVSQLEMNYSHYSYFAVSSLGLDNNPTEQGRIKTPRPHRIEDPMLWILKEKKVIKGQ